MTRLDLSGVVVAIIGQLGFVLDGRGVHLRMIAHDETKHTIRSRKGKELP
jgi:hypothetical protein